MKKSSIGIDVPAVGPLPQSRPTESLLRRGHEDVVVPVESTYRYGASRVTGLVGSVVYGPPHVA